MNKEELKEESPNGGNENRSNGEGAGSTGSTDKGIGTPSGEGGGESRTSGGEGGESGASGRASQGGEQESGGGPSEDRKTNLLQRIRNKRAERQHNASGTTNGTSVGNSQGVGDHDRGDKRRIADDARPSSRANRNAGRSGEQDSNGNGGTRETSQTNDNDARIKPKGVNIKGVDKIKALAQQASQAEPPKLRFTWDEKPLTNKEGDEILPKIKGLLQFLFRHADKGITITNRNRAEAHIWSAIDDEDIDIIASHLVEMGKASKIVATAVRRMTNSYRLLQIGLITLPKFIQTYQFYAANGGFAIMGGK